MKYLFGIAVFCSIIFLLDPMIIDWAMSLFPPSIKEWFKLINVVLWIVLLCCTFGISIAISMLAGFIFGLFTKPKNYWQLTQPKGQKQSGFMQRLEEAERKRSEAKRISQENKNKPQL